MRSRKSLIAFSVKGKKKRNGKVVVSQNFCSIMFMSQKRGKKKKGLIKIYVQNRTLDCDWEFLFS